MTISDANKALLERKFGRALPEGDPKVSLTISAIAKLLDAARAEERADSNRRAKLDQVKRIADEFLGRTSKPRSFWE